MRPGNELAPLAGLGGDGGDVANGYIQINTTGGPGAGLTSQSMQYHDVADIRGLAGAQQVASLHAGASTGAAGAAVTLRSVGGAGGQVAAFTYDLARSVVWTRQGNPAWVGRAAATPRRSHDFFEGRGQPDWVNLDKVAIPQADEQQRLLANLVIQMNMDRTPLPRFWYLPHGHKAAVVMTGDDHNGRARPGNSTASRPRALRVARWPTGSASGRRPTCGRRPACPNAVGYQKQGFEVALHLNAAYPSSNAGECADFTSLTQLNGMWNTQLAAFAQRLPGHPPAPDEPEPLHHLERLGEQSTSAAGARGSARHELLLLPWLLDREPARALHRRRLPAAIR